MASGQGANNFVAFAIQDTFGTAITDLDAFKYFPMKAGGIKESKPSKASDQLYGSEPQFMRKQNQSGEASIPMDCYYEGLATVLSMAFLHTETEVQPFEVTNTAKYIPFREVSSGGNLLQATLTLGFYTPEELCAEMKAALEAASVADGGNVTYTVTFNDATGAFTIENNSTYLKILFSSQGTNSIRNLIGWGSVDLTDSSSPCTLTGNALGAYTRCYDHVFIPVRSNRFLTAQNQDKGLTILCNMDLVTQRMDTAFPTTLAFAWGENDPHAPAITLGFKGRYIEEIAAISLPSGTLNDVPGNPDGNLSSSIQIGENEYIDQYMRSANYSINFPTDLKHGLGSTKAVKASRTGKHSAAFQTGWDFEDDNALRDDFNTAWEDKDNTVKIVMTQLGEIINTNPEVKQRLKITAYAARPIGDTAQATQGTLEQPYNFQLERDTVNDLPMIKIELRNMETLA